MSIKIGKRFEIYRSTETIHADETDERIPIILGIGRAFGSGDHETTASCLEELERIPIIENSKVLDVGCGTGVLSIAAAGLGARVVKAVDPSPYAVKVTTESIKLNKMEKKIIPLEGELKIVDDHDFDIIMANLYGDILLNLMGDMWARLKRGGDLLLSGILYEYSFDLKRALEQTGFDLLNARYLDEYITLLAKKR
jgi:ribosomal protein L11 methyltransferase